MNTGNKVSSITGVDINFIHRQLSQIEEELVARIPETIFVEHLLPIIASEPGHESLEPWEHLAGSTFNRIAVVDRADNVLFTVPPLAVSPNFDQNKEARHSLYEAMEHYKLLAALQPRSAAQYLDQKLASVVKPRSRDYEALLQIDNILERYNKPRRIPKEALERIVRLGNTTDDSTTTETTNVTDTQGSDVSDIGDEL